ncbi:hypothetical protein [Natrinema sp. HArc-T2]|uniref:hypothetical protein n=1 Tax=Natrinema sp. HArc-T2 TaxID=3242701 RepID=UPI00359E3A70
MGEPDWSKVLSAIYQSEMVSEHMGEKKISEDHPIVTDTDLTIEEAEKAIDYLDSIGLVDTLPMKFENAHGATLEGRTLSLTKEGFRVAHERAMKKRQREHERIQTGRQNTVNSAVASLTLVLAVSSVTQTTVAVVSTENHMRLLSMLLGSVTILLFIVVFQMYRAGLFEYDKISL